MRTQVVGAGGDLQPLVGGDRPVLADRVLQVHGADRRERKRPVGHDRHVQRERQHVRVGDRQRLLQREAAHLRVGRDAVAVDLHVVARQRQVEQRHDPDLRTPGSWLTTGTAGSAALSIIGSADGSPWTTRGSLATAQAPSIIWPHTRTTLPLTAVEPGLAYHAMVSATSTGCPPCCRALSRRPPRGWRRARPRSSWSR